MGARLPRPRPSCSATAGCPGLERGERRAVPWAPRARPTRLQGRGGRPAATPGPQHPHRGLRASKASPRAAIRGAHAAPARPSRPRGVILRAGREARGGVTGTAHGPGAEPAVVSAVGSPGGPAGASWAPGRRGAWPGPSRGRAASRTLGRGPGWVEGVSGSTGLNKGAPGTWRAPWGPQHLPLTVGSAPGLAGTTEPGGPPAPGSSAPWVPPPPGLKNTGHSKGPHGLLACLVFPPLLSGFQDVITVTGDTLERAGAVKV